jgi:hypothetical protein
VTVVQHNDLTKVVTFSELHSWGSSDSVLSSPVPSISFRCEKINFAFPFGVLRGGVKIEGGVNLSDDYGIYSLNLSIGIGCY